MSSSRILIIETDSSLSTNLAQHLRQQGFGVSEADHSIDFANLLDESPHQLVLLGLEGLKRDGIEILKILRERFPSIKVITLNSCEQLDLSIEGMRLGAYDDFLIPFDLDGLIACIRKALLSDKQ